MRLLRNSDINSAKKLLGDIENLYDFVDTVCNSGTMGVTHCSL